MELKEFVKKSILETMTAIYEAQLEWKSSVGKGGINPAWEGTDQLYKHVQQIEFDVAVTATDTESGKANAGIKVMSLDIGAAGEKGRQNSTISRIKFIVPVVAPVDVIVGGGRPE
nr:trypco2 family protein [uncultured Brevundimonas sp.]